MMLLDSKFRFFKTDRGVTMVEFALVLPLLLMLIIGIIDVSRYFAYQAILNKGAENGLNFALKVPNLDVDLSQYQTTDIDYLRYIQARDLVAQKAADIPLRTFFSDNTTPSIAQLENFSYSDKNALGTTNTNVETAALIFPGESLTASDGTVIAHKTLPTPPTAQSKEDLLKVHPVIVELRAQVQPLTPFMPAITLQARAMGYREEIPRGPLTGEFGLVDPVGGVPNPPATTTTTTTTLPPPPSPDPLAIAALDFSYCAGQPTPKCPNANNPTPGSGLICVECSPSGNPGIP